MELHGRSMSEAQDSLADLVRQTLPWMSVRQEVPLCSIVSAAGYSVDEIAVELRHRPSAMSVDVFATDLSDSIAFEYQGEQHYASRGRMNASENAVRRDQALDAEKAWILQRIGVPIVQVAYDDPLSKRFLRRRIDDATDDMIATRMQLVPCASCGRLFPAERLDDGMCARCASLDGDAGAPGRASHGARVPVRRRDVSGEYAAEMARRGEEARAERKRRREEYLRSDEHAETMRRQREMRHERYLRERARRRRDGR